MSNHLHKTKYIYEKTGKFQIILTVMDNRGLKNSSSLSLVINDLDFSVMPNPFTPNNDGYNDVVEFNFSKTPTFKTNIFQRNSRKLSKNRQHFNT